METVHASPLRHHLLDGKIPIKMKWIFCFIQLKKTMSENEERSERTNLSKRSMRSLTSLIFV